MEVPHDQVRDHSGFPPPHYSAARKHFDVAFAAKLSAPDATLTPEASITPPDLGGWAALCSRNLGTPEGSCCSIMSDPKQRPFGSNYPLRWTRSQIDTISGWNLDVRCNLASVSKSVTAVALLKLLGDKNISVDTAFYPYVQSQIPVVGPGVNTVTFRHLLEMKSGMVQDGTLWFQNGDMWAFLSTYLAAQNVQNPGTGDGVYSNTNYTILQATMGAIIGNLSGYADYVTENVLKPMSIDVNDFSVQADPLVTSPLSYANDQDTRNGAYWGAIDAQAAGGWWASTQSLMDFLLGLANNVVLSEETKQTMFQGQLGWYAYPGKYGTYYHHNGGLFHITNGPTQATRSGIMVFADQSHAAVLCNSDCYEPIFAMIDACEGRVSPGAGPPLP